MSAGQFSQPNVVYALCLALAKANVADECISACSLAEAVAPKFPNVPVPALRVIAAKVLRLYFEPIEVADIATAGLDGADAAAACDFFGAELLAEADYLRDEIAQRDGANVVSLSDSRQP